MSARLSIVVPTRDRSASLHRLLRSLARQDSPELIGEVIVVDDASLDATTAVLDAFEAPWPMHRLHTDGRGPALARNRGAEAAREEIVLFLDDDLEASPGLAGAHAAAHDAAADDVAVVGPYPPRHEPTRSPFRILTRNWWEDHFRELLDPGHRLRSTDLLSGNLSMRREAFLREGGFDETFEGCRAEDWELGTRWLGRGKRIVPCPEAHAIHFEIETTWPGRALNDARREGRGVALLDRKHPEFAAAREAGPLLDGRMKRAVRHLAADRPTLGDVLDRIVRFALPGLAFLRARRSWRHAWGLLHLYGFWRAYEECRREFPAVPTPPPAASLPEPLEIDLALGLEEAERRLDEARPRALRLSWNDRPIGNVPEDPGCEPWRGGHLRKLLADRFADDLARELAR